MPFRNSFQLLLIYGMFFSVTFLRAQPAIPKIPRNPATTVNKPPAAKKPVASHGTRPVNTSKEGLLTVKLISNADGTLFVDGLQKGKIEAQVPYRIQLAPGEYIIKIAGNEHPDDIFRELLTMNGSPGTEKLYQINLLEVISRRVKAAELYAAADQFFFGKGVNEDKNKAFDLYSNAANLGYTDAMITLSYLYHEGIVVGKNMLTANEWFIKALDQISTATETFTHPALMKNGSLTPQQTLRETLYAQWHTKFRENDPSRKSMIGNTQSLFFRMKHVATRTYLNLESDVLLSSPVSVENWSAMWCMQQIESARNTGSYKYIIANRWKDVLLYLDPNNNVQTGNVNAARNPATWILENIPGTNRYRIKNEVSSQYLYVSRGALVSGKPENNNPVFEWSFEPFEQITTKPDAYYFIPAKNYSGRKQALTVQQANFNYRASLILSEFRGNTSQQFYFDSFTGYIHLVEKAHLVLDVTSMNGPTYQPNDVIVWSMNNGLNQKWYLEKAEDNENQFYLRNRQNHLYLTAESTERKPGAGLKMIVKEKKSEALIWTMNRAE